MKRRYSKLVYFCLSAGMLIAALTFPMNAFARWDCEIVGEYPCFWNVWEYDCNPSTSNTCT